MRIGRYINDTLFLKVAVTTKDKREKLKKEGKGVFLSQQTHL
jgi:hypothetical protein